MTTPTRDARALLLLTAAALLTGACQNTRETLTGEWQETLEGMTIRPVFPPREDFQVGDVYLRHPQAPALEQWVATLDLRKQGEAFYARRAPYPGEETRSGRSSGASQLRQVVFPAFAGVNVRGQNIDWLIPAEALSLAEGDSWQGDHEITLRISSAESHGLPFNVISEALVVEVEDGSRTLQRLRPELGISLPTLARTQVSPDVDVPDRHVRLDVVTEVYYARTIDISLTRLRRPAQEEAEPIELVDAAAQVDNKSLVDSLNRRLDDAAPSTPGSTLRILGATDAGVVLRRAFEHPIAIGYRAMTLTLDRKTGEIISYDSQTPLGSTRKETTRRERFDLSGALALELADQLHGQAELLDIHYDTEISRWVLLIEKEKGAEPPFLPLSRRKEIAERAGERAGRLSAEDRRRLQRFVDAGGILFETPE